MVSHMAPFVPMPPMLASLLSHGGAGVDAFFVLSGLVIVQSLQAHGWRRMPFLAARARRIFPVFLPVFAFAVAVQALDGLSDGGVWETMPWIASDSPARSIWSIGWPHDWPVSIAAHLVMAHGVFPDGVMPGAWVGFLGAAWSLSTEWQFYLLAAAAAPLIRRDRDGLAAFATALLALAAAGAAWQALAPPSLTFSRAFLPNKATYFALGVASVPVLRKGLTCPAPTALFSAVLVATLLLCSANGVDKLAVPLAWVAVLAAQTGAGGRAPVLLTTAWLGRWLTGRALLWLGAVSYPLYLVNEPVQKLLGRALAIAAHGNALLFGLAWVPGALLLPLGLAWLLHIWIERPMQRRGSTYGAAGGRVVGARAEGLCAAPGWISRTHSRDTSIPTSRSPMG